MGLYDTAVPTARQTVEEFLRRKREAEALGLENDDPSAPAVRSASQVLGRFVDPTSQTMQEALPVPPQAPQAAIQPAPPPISGSPPLVNPETVRGNVALTAEATPTLAKAADTLASGQREASDEERLRQRAEMQAALTRDIQERRSRPISTPNVPQEAPGTDWMAEIERAQGSNRRERMLTAGANLFALGAGHNVPRLAAADREGEVSRRMSVEQYLNAQRDAAQTRRQSAMETAEMNDPSSASSQRAAMELLGTAEYLTNIGQPEFAETVRQMVASPGFSAATAARAMKDDTSTLGMILKSSTTANGQLLNFLSRREGEAGTTGRAGLNAATDITNATNDNATDIHIAELRNALKARRGGGARRAALGPQELDLYARIVSAKGTVSYDDAYLAGQALASGKNGAAFRTQLGSMLAPAGREASGTADNTAAARLIQMDGAKRSEGLGLVRRADEAVSTASGLSQPQMAQVLAYANTGWVPDAAMSPEQDDMLDTLRSLTNVYLHKQSGAAVNASEAERLLGELGINQMTSPSHVSRALRSFAQRAKQDYETQYGRFDEIVGGMEGPSQASVTRPAAPRPTRQAAPPSGATMRKRVGTNADGTPRYEYR